MGFYEGGVEGEQTWLGRSVVHETAVFIRAMREMSLSSIFFRNLSPPPNNKKKFFFTRNSVRVTKNKE